MEKYIQRQHQGFTLIEVLIALAILSISLTAIIKTTSQTIRDTTYLQNKTTATWVGLLVMNEARMGLINLSRDSDDTNEEMTMLNQSWEWKASTNQTKNPHIKEIHIEVKQKSQDVILANLVGYLYAQ